MPAGGGGGFRCKRSLVFPCSEQREGLSAHHQAKDDVEDLTQDGEPEVVPCSVPSSQRSNHSQPGGSQPSNSSSSQVMCAQRWSASSQDASENELPDSLVLQTPSTNANRGQDAADAQSAAKTRQKRKRSRPVSEPQGDDGRPQALSGGECLPQTVATRRRQPTLCDLMQASLLVPGDVIACRMYDGA